MPFLDVTRESLEYYRIRINGLTPTTPRRWGHLESASLLRHLRRSLEISLGEVPGLKDSSVPLLRDLLYWVFFRMMTKWPGGIIKSGRLFTPPPRYSFEEERAALLKGLQRFVAALEQTPELKTVHPILGPLPLTAWSHVHGVHFHHHFRQFNLEE